MTTLEVKTGQPIPDEYPPRYVIADAWGGIVTILKLDHPDDTLDQAHQRCVQLQRGRKRANKKDIAYRKGKAHND